MKVKTKYKIGDEVWYISNNQVKHQKIHGVGISVGATVTNIIYTLQGNDKVEESHLFNTKEELLNTL